MKDLSGLSKQLGVHARPSLEIGSRSAAMWIQTIWTTFKASLIASLARSDADNRVRHPSNP
jgi:hypothetical protein